MVFKPTAQLILPQSYGIVSSNVLRRIRMLPGLRNQKAADFDNLLNRVKEDRCEEAFRSLFDHFYGRILAYFEKSGVPGPKATDLAQDTLLVLWHKASLFDPAKGSCQAWIFTIARNLRFDYFRSDSSKHLSIDSNDLYENLEDPSFQFDAKNLSDDLKGRIETLPAEQKEVVQAMYFEGYSHREYAEIKKIPLGTVKSRIRLALAHLKKELREP